MLQPLAAPTIFLITIYLTLARPRNLNPGFAALIGAVAALALGVITLADVWTVTRIVWDATFALIGIVVISVILDGAGFFRWASLWMARVAGGNGRTIFIAVTLLGAFVSTLFTNDATVLILTPIVYEMLVALGFSQRMMLPYMMACGFVADTMSIPLVVSNLTNMITARYFEVGFGRFALLMLLPSLASLAATLAVLLWYYRKEIPLQFDMAAVARPETGIRDPFLFKAGIVVLSGMVLAFFLNSTLLDLPISMVIATGAAVLLIATQKNRVVKPTSVIWQAPWHVIIFALGMYLVVYGFGRAGLTQTIGYALTWLVQWGEGWAIVGTGSIVAVLSSLMNNLPGVMLGSLAIEATEVSGPLREGMVLANAIGADIGPKMTPIGSLATLIWLHALQMKGMRITWQYYLKVGLIITPPVLLITLLALWASVTLLG